MALRDPLPGTDPVGAEHPRLAPPVPLRSLADEYVKQAIDIGITPFPWERVAYHYITALDVESNQAAYTTMYKRDMVRQQMRPTVTAGPVDGPDAEPEKGDQDRVGQSERHPDRPRRSINGR